MTSVGGLLLPLFLVACSTPRTATPARVVHDVAAESAVVSGDAKAIRALLDGEVIVGGLVFADKACKELESGRFEEAKFDALASCLAGLHWTKSARTDELAEVAVLNYGPGFEIEARVVRDDETPRLTWIGFATRKSGDTAVTITPETLESLRVDGTREITLAPEIAHPATAWIRVCVDESGVLSTRALSVSSPEAGDAIETAVKAWKFRSFEVDTWPIAACASVHVSDPPESQLEVLPTAVPLGTLAISRPQMLETYRIEGDPAIVPDDMTRQEIFAAGNPRVSGSFRLCLDVTGAVSSIVMFRTTGFADYDRKIIARMKKWKYRPFLVRGAASPVCTAITFVFGQENGPTIIKH